MGVSLGFWSEEGCDLTYVVKEERMDCAEDKGVWRETNFEAFEVIVDCTKVVVDVVRSDCLPVYFEAKVSKICWWIGSWEKQKSQWSKQCLLA